MSNKLKYILIFICFIVISIFGFFLLPKDEIVSLSISDNNDDYIYVHIEGEVNNPGLVKIKYGTRLYELIEEAGGETDDADLTRVNLSSVLNDEQKVIIPARIIASNDDENSQTSDGGLVNINTASKEMLMKLDGVGAGTAEKIIKYRQENGCFNSIEDLKKVSGIGESKYNGLKDDITV